MIVGLVGRSDRIGEALSPGAFLGRISAYTMAITVPSRRLLASPASRERQASAAHPQPVSE